ncbi:MAG: UvrD-helicase domain-containing protein [Clostridia bacterium]|nr:UvrD-helicase domain-containing protein [Clostridia bacterium]
MEAKEFTPSQKKAISHTGSDLLISAGAGSGKTATLTERIIRKILGGADITKMLVVTFTKEAANELKSRITDSIVKQLKLNPENEHLRSQIVKISSADISTIHSFCLKVIRPNFDKLSIDSDFRVGEENEIATIKSEVMREVISSFYESDTEDEDFLIVSDSYSQLSSDDALEEKLLTLYGKLSSTSLFLDTLLVSQDYNGDFINTLYGKVVLEEISFFTSHYRRIYQDIINEIIDKDGAPKYLSAFTSDLDLIERLENATREPSYSKFKEIFASYVPLALNGIAKSSIDVDFAKMVRDKFKKTVEDKFKKSLFLPSEGSLVSAFKQNARICKAIYKILAEFDEKFGARKRKYGLCDFNDIERYTYRLLCGADGSPTALARELACQYDEIYIDEYQDTNSLQDSIFASISQNNRFMVGDIKQSIYRFRSAEPEIFSHYRSTFEDITLKDSDSPVGKTIFMSENFRCDESVIDFTNEVSDYMFFNSNGIPYEKMDNLKYRKKNGDIHTPQECEIRVLDRALIDTEKVTEKHEILQAKYVAKRILDLLEKGKLPNGEPIKSSDIAILLRKGRFKQYYIDELARLGIAAEYIDDVKFFEKPHVLLLLSILNAIDNPYKDTYLAGALHSDVFNFSLDELLTIRRYSDRSLPLYSALLKYDDNAEIVNKIDNFIKKLSYLQGEIKRMNAYEAVSFVMRECGLLSASAKVQRKDFIKFYNQAREFEKSSYKGLYKFLLHIERVRDSSSQETVFTNPDDCVRIMSVHASKGLEFEICFVCNTESGFAMQDTKEPILFERHLGIAGYVGNTGGLVKYNTLLRRCTALAIEKSSREEEMRVLYVAMTRARSKLIVVGSMLDAHKEIDLIKKLAPYTSPLYLYSQSCPLEYIMNTFYLPRDFVDFQIVDPNTLTDAGACAVVDVPVVDSEDVLALQKTLNERFNFEYQYDYLNKIPSKLSVSRLYPNILDDTENNEIDLKKALKAKPSFLSSEEIEVSGADRGTATHVFMQFCDFYGLLKNGVESEIKRLLDGSFISQSDAEIINKEHLEGFVKSGLFGEMLKAKAMHREFRFNVMLSADEFSSDERIKREKVLVQGVIDAVFENENGEIILVDYKTDKVTEKNYKEVLCERYTTQLSYYKKAIELILEKPVSKVLLYSVPLARTVEI